MQSLLSVESLNYLYKKVLNQMLCDLSSVEPPKGKICIFEPKWSSKPELILVS